MTVRDAILLAMPVFVAHARDGSSAVRGELKKAGIPAKLAAEIVEFLPLALARAMLEGMGVQFADHYVRQTAQGHVVGQKPLADEPVFREGLAIAGQISGGVNGEFMAVAGLSPEYRGDQQGAQFWVAVERPSLRPAGRTRQRPGPARLRRHLRRYSTAREGVVAILEVRNWGTNTILLSRPTRDGRRWHFAFASLVGGPVTAKHGDKEVFSIEKNYFQKDTTRPYLRLDRVPVPKE